MVFKRGENGDFKFQHSFIAFIDCEHNGELLIFAFACAVLKTLGTKILN